jgi:hypothetical protein
MTSIHVRMNLRRAFACWPSRIGAMSLIALMASWGMETYYSVATPPPQSVAAVD